MDKRRVTAISLNENEKALAVRCSSRIGSSVSQLFRIALIEYAANHETSRLLEGNKEDKEHVRKQ